MHMGQSCAKKILALMLSTDTGQEDQLAKCQTANVVT